MFNVLDLIIMTAFMAIIGAGFFGGISRVTSAVIAIYFGAIFSAALYGSLTNVVLSYVVTMNRKTGSLVIFVLLFFVFSTAFTVIISRWLGDLHLPRRIAIIDNIGGAALGVAVSALALTLASMLLSLMLQALNQTFGMTGGDVVVVAIHHQIRSSALVPIFLKMAPFYLRALEPWFPGGLPPILVNPQG